MTLVHTPALFHARGESDRTVCSLHSLESLVMLTLVSTLVTLTVRPTPAVSAFIVLVCLCCGGCGEMIAPFVTKVPSKAGTWTGRLECVTVHGRENEYSALALDIDTGPRAIGRGPDYRMRPGRDLVLLCRRQGVIDPAEVKAVVGSRVMVDGTLRGGGPTIKLIERIGKDGGVTDSVRMAPEPQYSGFQIDIRVRGHSPRDSVTRNAEATAARRSGTLGVRTCELPLRPHRRPHSPLTG